MPDDVLLSIRSEVVREQTKGMSIEQLKATVD